MNTPYFLIHEDILKRNVDEFQTALASVWGNAQLSFSVKTNSLPWLLRYFCASGLWAEVVSDEEFELAQQCGFTADRIVFNGPIKGSAAFQSALHKGSILNCDSQRELFFLVNYTGKKPASIGLRVNVPPALFSESDIGYVEDGFRFGYAVKSGDFERALRHVRACFADIPVGLHLHINSVSRSVRVYQAAAHYAASLIRQYDLNVPYIDMGGGFFGGVEGKPSAETYIRAIRQELEGVVDPAKVRLIIEPGSALIGSAVDLVTSVLDVKDTGYARIVTTDGSRIHIDPLWKKTRYRYVLHTKRDNLIDVKQIICGYTCMDHDRIMILQNATELSVGDRIIYERVGAYSMTFGGPFICYFPDVYVAREGVDEQVRHKMSVADYIAIHS